MNKETLFQNLTETLEKRQEQYVVFSGNIYTFESAFNEILALQEGAKLVKWLNAQSAIVYLPDGMKAFYRNLKQHPPIYIQHIFPIQYVFAIDNFDLFAESLASLCGEFTVGKTFSVQTTIFSSEIELSTFDINKRTSDSIARKGNTLDTKNPYYVISIAVEGAFFYVGISTAKENLSKWTCGKVHYSKEINRAEYKLVECIEHFEINIEGEKALDIGAAPGGWTKALYDRGYKVWAVDPAMLQYEILNHKNVVYMQMTAQTFLKDNTEAFDIIVNDMILDCRESARIMNEASKHLHSEGCGIFTAKLPKKGYNKRLKTAIKILEKEYIISGVRQLPSNKSEVTIVLKRNIIR
ncbi:MAG: methyltransferase domain-containing protein [Clostridiales bacterium]|nr:methyltransferase domain-containing protein [Clostridiales bacterium]